MIVWNFSSVTGRLDKYNVAIFFTCPILPWLIWNLVHVLKLKHGGKIELTFWIHITSAPLYKNLDLMCDVKTIQTVIVAVNHGHILVNTGWCIFWSHWNGSGTLIERLGDRKHPPPIMPMPLNYLCIGASFELFGYSQCGLHIYWFDLTLITWCDTEVLITEFFILLQGGEIYDAILNQTNVGANNNKFYVIQALGIFIFHSVYCS